MKKRALRLTDYLGHIQTAIERIERYTGSLDQDEFQKNELVQDAVVRNFEIIGEASRNIERLDPAFVEAHPEFPLKYAYDMRNQLAHGYFQVDLGIVWKTARNQLPALAKSITDLSDSLKSIDGEICESCRRNPCACDA